MKDTSYTILKDIWDKLDTMDQKWDGRINGIERRIGVVEQFRIQALAIAAVCSVGVGLLKDQIIKMFFHST